jgi:hypothetical protein
MRFSLFDFHATASRRYSRGDSCRINAIPERFNTPKTCVNYLLDRFAAVFAIAKSTRFRERNRESESAEVNHADNGSLLFIFVCVGIRALANCKFQVGGKVARA